MGRGADGVTAKDPMSGTSASEVGDAMESDSPTLMERLRSETSDLHSHAESRKLQKEIAQGSVEQRDFVAYLGQLSHVHQVLESALDSGRGAHPAVARLATPDRMRVPDLVRDLEFYGVDRATVDRGAAATRFAALIENTRGAEPAALLGAFYVLEGSTNGGRFLARALRKSWNLQGGGLSYLDPYGDRQTEQWKLFKREMDACRFDPSQEEAIIGMARATFEAIAEVSDEVSGGEA